MEGGPTTKKESVLSPERKEQVEAVFNKLKGGLEDKGD